VSNSAQYSEEILGDTIDGSIRGGPCLKGIGGSHQQKEIKHALDDHRYSGNFVAVRFQFSCGRSPHPPAAGYSGRGSSL